MTTLSILHVRGNHWSAISNINLNRCQGVSDRVFIYDSLLSTTIHFEKKQQICALVCTTSKSIRLDVMNIMRQLYDYDCGLFSIANIIELAVGLNPGKCVWDTDKMRQHLISCFRNNKMKHFPVLKTDQRTDQSPTKDSPIIIHYLSSDVVCVCVEQSF